MIREVEAKELERKAFRFQAIVEEKTLQKEGMIPMFVRADDYELPTAEDYAGAYRHRHLLGKTEKEIGIAPMHVWRAWENTATDTAYYLGAMAYQYRCTGSEEALSICRRTLGALKYIHGLSAERGERGFLCKPYGGVYSNQSSGDQVQCVLFGLSAYRPIAPPEDLKILDGMIRDFADFEIANEYVPIHGYFAYTRQRCYDGSFGENWEKVTWSYAIIYITLLYMAWLASGNVRYVKEIERWYDACDTKQRFEIPKGKISGGLGWRDLYLPSLLMEFDPVNHELWKSMMMRKYRILRTGALDDGTIAINWTCDTESEKREILPAASWKCGDARAKTGRNAMFAMGCVKAQPWFEDEDMTAVARRILGGLNEDTFRFIMPYDEAEPLSPEWRIESRLLDHDSLTAWLWAYWEGRWRSYW